MEMFLMAAALSLLGVAVSAVLFGAATRHAPADEPRQVVDVTAPATARFFDRPLPDGSMRVPVEALLLEIERHVRLEQAAAESFVDAPTIESLNSRTMSRLVH